MKTFSLITKRTYVNWSYPRKLVVNIFCACANMRVQFACDDDVSTVKVAHELKYIVKYFLDVHIEWYRNAVCGMIIAKILFCFNGCLMNALRHCS